MKFQFNVRIRCKEDYELIILKLYYIYIILLPVSDSLKSLIKRQFLISFPSGDLNLLCLLLKFTLQCNYKNKINLLFYLTKLTLRPDYLEWKIDAIYTWSKK